MERIIAADFETTSFDGQEYTEVWSAAFCELYSEDVTVLTSIDDFFSVIFRYKSNLRIYFHNLKFDGSFIISYFLKNSNIFREGFINSGDSEFPEFKKSKELLPGEFTYSVSSKGMWYTICVRNGKYLIEFRDSYKLMPFKLADIAKAFGTKHKKLDMEYKGERHAGGTISRKEQRYIKNDVLVLKEALEFMIAEGHDKLTIGACAVKEFKSGYHKSTLKELMPNMQDFRIDVNTYGEADADAYIRHSYKGGWCYLKTGCENRLYIKGVTLDVNSLYPFVMHSDSGFYYPVGQPHFWSGNYLHPYAKYEDSYYFIRVKTRFHIKPGMLPTIQIKGTFRYNGRQWLHTSDMYNPKTGKYDSTYIDFEGVENPCIPTLWLTKTDFELLQSHYYLEDFEILDGCYFETERGIFDEYIEKYRKIKETSKGAKRTEAKLFLNNLYGKLSTSRDSSYKVAFLNEEGALRFFEVPESKKKVMYIPIGAAITSYARYYTITAAQKNYKHFIYADTDSIHCDCDLDEIQGVELHHSKFGCWDDELHWDSGMFVRQKTYIEEKGGHYKITCAGMPEASKKLLELSLSGCIHGVKRPLKVCNIQKRRFKQVFRLAIDNAEKHDFLQRTRTLKDFKEGLTVPGCLKAKNISGGIVLNDDVYTMRPVK